MELRYGDPPSSEECKDYGTYPVPETLGVSLDPEVQQREMGILSLIEKNPKLTPWTRARYAVRHVESKGVPGKVSVKGLGVVLVGKEGWTVVNGKL